MTFHRILCACVALVIPACLGLDDGDSPVDVTETEQAATGCPGWICGTSNTPYVDNLGFHDLNLDGLPNSAGFYVSSFTKGGRTYKLDVSKGEVTGIDVATGARLSGSALVNAQIRLDNTNGRTYTLRFREVSKTAYWAKIATQKYTPTYLIEWAISPGPDPGAWSNICVDPPPADSLEVGGPNGMNPYHVVTPEADRWDSATGKVYTTDKRWFSLGCAASAIAKVHLMGHTQAAANLTAGDPDPFVSNLGQRTAVTMAVTARYCGSTGGAMTVKGMPYTNDDPDHTPMWLQLNPQGAPVEALWSSTGALCINEPRGAFNPTAAFRAYFPDIKATILSLCPERYVPCPATPPAGTFFLTANRH